MFVTSYFWHLQTPLKGKVQEYLQLRAKCQLKGGWLTVAISGAIFISLDDPISLREVISRCIDLECEGHGTPTPILGGPVGKEGGELTFYNFPYRQSTVIHVCSGTFHVRIGRILALVVLLVVTLFVDKMLIHVIIEAVPFRYWKFGTFGGEIKTDKMCNGGP